MQPSKSQSKVSGRSEEIRKYFSQSQSWDYCLLLLPFFVLDCWLKSLIERCFYLFIHLSIYLAIVFFFSFRFFFFSGAMVSKFN